MIDRMVRASQFDANLYEQVERDVNATGQAATVVLIAAVASGIGGIREGGIGGLISGVIGIFVAWLLWGVLTYWIGKNVFGTANTRVSPGEMLRTLGFAMSPGILWVLGFIPILGWIISPIVGIWILVLGIIAIRQAMDFTTGRAVGTALVGAIPFIIIFGLLGAITGGLIG